MNDLLLEIYGEELPSSAQIIGENQLYQLFLELFTKKKIHYSSIETFSTSRRVSIVIKKISQNEKDNFININDIESSINSILRNRSNPKSIISLIKNVRNNSKIVRNSLTRETWQSINECWIKFDKVSKNKIHFQKIPEVLENLLKDYLIFLKLQKTKIIRS